LAQQHWQSPANTSASGCKGLLLAPRPLPSCVADVLPTVLPSPRIDPEHKKASRRGMPGGNKSKPFSLNVFTAFRTMIQTGV